jgi:cob(I)alamin adenosyltransferase
MMAAGWNILRAGQHYVYARVLDEAGGHRQMLVLPSTSSDSRHLANARAQLRRLDREALELAAAWSAAQAAPS